MRGAGGRAGTVVFHSGGRHWAVTATGTPQNIAGDQGTVIWRAGAFDWLIGRVVFRLRL